MHMTEATRVVCTTHFRIDMRHAGRVYNEMILSFSDISVNRAQRKISGVLYWASKRASEGNPI